MSYPPEHRERVKEKIIRSARALFNRHGFDDVSIEDIMAGAGLTRGGFYKYFGKKSDLYAESISLSLRDPRCTSNGVTVDFSADDAAQQLIRAYLSREHLEDIEESCPLVALPNYVARSDPEVKRIYGEVFKSMVDLFQMGIRHGGPSRRRRALAMAGICVGGMVVARALADRDAADSLREAAMTFALRLGGWSNARKRGAAGHRGRRRGAI